MELLVWISTVFLILGVGGVAVMKLSNKPDVVEQAVRLGYEPVRRSTAIAELFGVAGVLIGAVLSNFEWLGIAAAIGIAAMMVGAIFVHLRARDTWPTLPSVLMLIAAILYIVGITSA